MIDHSKAPWTLGAIVYLEAPGYHTAGGQRYREVRSANGDPVALVLADEDDPDQLADLMLIHKAPWLLKVLVEIRNRINSEWGDIGRFYDDLDAILCRAESVNVEDYEGGSE